MSDRHKHKKCVMLRVPDEMHARLVELCDGRPVSRVALRVVEQWMAKQTRVQVPDVAE